MASSVKRNAKPEPGEWVNPGKTPREVSAHFFKRKIEMMNLEQLMTLRQEVSHLLALLAEMQGSRAQHMAASKAERKLRELGIW